MIYVQHLLGVGHLQRAAQLANALIRDGCSVLLVSGGFNQKISLDPQVQFLQLSPLRSADSSFSRLLDENDRLIDDNWRSNRCNQLLSAFDRFRPQVLLTETFPFGRRMLRFELLPLLETAADSEECNLIVASIRDILQPKSSASRNREICDLITGYYAYVLVHGDPRVARLEHSFALTEEIAAKVVYGGYIANAEIQEPDGNDGYGEVLVAAGGSATGLTLLQTAISARALCSLKDLRWRILASPAISQQDFEGLRQSATKGIIIERNRTDYTGLMRRARLSVSQAGYNTVTDIFSAGVKAVVVPFAEAGEIEQNIRAAKLERLQRVAVVAADDLSPQSLASAIDRADHLPISFKPDLDGAAKASQLIRQWWQQQGSIQ